MCSCGCRPTPTHPTLLDAGAVVQQLQRALKGVRYLDGGWQGMVDGVAATAAAAGAEITDHVAVDRIERAGDGWALSTSAGRGTRPKCGARRGRASMWLPGCSASSCRRSAIRAPRPGLRAWSSGSTRCPTFRCCSRPMRRSTSRRTCRPPGSARPARRWSTWPSTSHPTKRRRPRSAPGSCGTTPGPPESSRAARPCLPPGTCTT